MLSYFIRLYCIVLIWIIRVIGMYKSAELILAVLEKGTFLRFIDIWMIIFFLPTMAFITVFIVFAVTIKIMSGMVLFLFLPIWAFLWCVLELIILYWWSSKILNIMCINASMLWMVVWIRTINCFIFIY